MKFEWSKVVFWIIAITIGIFLLAVIGVYIYLFFTQPNIVPQSETFASFWLKNFSLIIAVLAFATSALSASYNSLEQRHLRYMENYPYLEMFPILSVDTLPLPVPRVDLLPELQSFATDYLKTVAPSHPQIASDTEFRYLAVVMHNVGHGAITRATIAGSAQVPGRGMPPVKFKIDRRFNLAPGDKIPFTLLPIAGLPEYKINLSSVEYSGHFVKLKDFDGPKQYAYVHPFLIPPEQRATLLLEDFENVPAGTGWMLDFWGQWQPTNYIYVPPPTRDEHYLLLSGDNATFAQYHHYNNQSGAYKDLLNLFSYGETVRVTAKVRSTAGTTAQIQIWCHDLVASPKNRYSPPIVPTQNWQEISMLYTSTQSPHLRIHLLYSPGQGEIHVDRIVVEGLHT